MEVTLRGRAIAQVANNDNLITRKARRHGHAGGVRQLGADARGHGHVVARPAARVAGHLAALAYIVGAAEKLGDIGAQRQAAVDRRPGLAQRGDGVAHQKLHTIGLATGDQFARNGIAFEIGDGLQ